MNTQFPCGCLEFQYGGIPPMVLLQMCNQHLAIVNNPDNKPHLGRMLPPSRTSTTIPGIPSPFGFPFQMGGLHPGQMPPQGVHIGMQRQGTSR
jgi:hypothetical protein